MVLCFRCNIPTESWLHLDFLLPKRFDFGDFDAQAPEVVTEHSGPGGSQIVTFLAGSSGLPSSVFLFLVLSIFMGFVLSASYETPG